jgi:RNA polymerase sigma-70 factor (ECF subfamily)
LTLTVIRMSHAQTTLNTAVSSSREPLEKIVIRLQNGEESALDELIARTEKACFRLALSILKDPELSRDALQEAYLILYQRVEQLRNPSAIKTWLFRTLTRCCRQIAIKRGREIESDMEIHEQANQSTVGIQGAPDPATQVARQEKIRSTFDQLPEIDRTTLALREIAHLSYEEMARALSVPIGTVRSRLAKARKRFIATYKGEKS